MAFFSDDEPDTEVHDFQLQRQLAELRERSDAKDREVAKPVQEDDLRWLLDKEEGGGSLSVGAAREAKEELAYQAEIVTKKRIAFGTLHNQTLRRQRKLEALEEEMRLLQHEAATTPRESRAADQNQARHDATAARVLQMESLADQQCEYTQTLQMMISRSTTEKYGVNERLGELRSAMELVAQKTDRQIAESGVLKHAKYQARNARQMQEQVRCNHQSGTRPPKRPILFRRIFAASLTVPPTHASRGACSAAQRPGGPCAAADGAQAAAPAPSRPWRRGEPFG